MVDEVTAALMDAIELLEKQQKSREVSLAITNAQQALMWWANHQRKMSMVHTQAEG